MKTILIPVRLDRLNTQADVMLAIENVLDNKRYTYQVPECKNKKIHIDKVPLSVGIYNFAKGCLP